MTLDHKEEYVTHTSQDLANANHLKRGHESHRFFRAHPGNTPYNADHTEREVSIAFRFGWCFQFTKDAIPCPKLKGAGNQPWLFHILDLVKASSADGAFGRYPIMGYFHLMFL
jgi:hypothetical protein